MRVELLNYTKDGREYWLDFSVVPLFDEKGDVSHFGAIESDITQQKSRRITYTTLLIKIILQELLIDIGFMMLRLSLLLIISGAALTLRSWSLILITSKILMIHLGT